MASDPEKRNPLVSTSGSSEVQVVLHPLVLLSISDYIARHTLRAQAGPLVGGLLGQQNGREITIEHAFDVSMIESDAPGRYSVDTVPFLTRLDQMKLVHKDRQLDFVGWYTLLPASGPDESILAVHRFFLSSHNESAILLGFHPDQVQTHTAGGKLPLTIYESNWEVDGSGRLADSEDRHMDDGEAAGLQLRFRELTYSVETEETEMISMNYVAAGGSNATAAPDPSRDDRRPSRSIESDGKGKRRIVESKVDHADEDVLSRDEQETIASLTTKSNAIKMLQSRIDLITKYLERMPSGADDQQPMDPNAIIPHLPVLRQIHALVSRLDLVIPSDRDAFDQEVLQESNDVYLVNLLNSVMQGVDQAREVGRKFAIVDASKNTRRQGNEYSSLRSALNSMPMASGDIAMQ